MARNAGFPFSLAGCTMLNYALFVSFISPHTHTPILSHVLLLFTSFFCLLCKNGPSHHYHILIAKCNHIRFTNAYIQIYIRWPRCAQCGRLALFVLYQGHNANKAADPCRPARKTENVCVCVCVCVSLSTPLTPALATWREEENKTAM